MKRLSFILVLCALIALPQIVSAANGTTMGTVISNKATVSGGNFSSVVSATVRTQVRRIAGGTFTAAGADVTGAVALAIYSNEGSLVNQGNSTINFRIGVVTATNGVCGGYWTYTVLQNNTPIGDLTAVSGDQLSTANISVAEDASVTIKIIATAAGTLTDGWNEFNLYAVTPDSHVNTTSYTSDDTATLMGGSWGWLVADQLDWTGTGVADGSLQQDWRITGAGAVTIAIVKSIVGVTLGGVPSLLVPGATIEYNIRVTNSSVGTGTGVVVTDAVDVVNMIIDGYNYQAGPENSWTITDDGTTITYTLNGDTAMEGGNWADLRFTAIVR